MVGEIWHYFDRQIDYPLTLINVSDLGDVELHKYDVLILPDGYYRDELNGPRMNEVQEWITEGGRLIAVEGANSMLAGKEGFALKSKDNNNGDGNEEQAGENGNEDNLEIYGERERERISSFNSGSIFKLAMDNSHPLAFGYDDTYFTLKRNSDAYAYLDDGWNVGVAKEDAHMSGFVGYKAKEKLENTLTFGVQNMGSGSVVYMVDNPLFRAFWYNGKLLFGNAVFFN